MLISMSTIIMLLLWLLGEPFQTKRRKKAMLQERIPGDDRSLFGRKTRYRGLLKRNLVLQGSTY